VVGGGDSTLLLYKLCNELKQAKDDKYKKPIALISEPFYFDTKKRISEAKARVKIEEEFIAKGLAFDKILLKSEIQDSNNLLKYGTHGLPQPGLWVLQFLPLLEDDSVLHFGYINGDHFWYQDDNFKTMVNSFCKMLGKTVTLQFDLYYMEKEKIVGELKQHELFQYIWFCEMPGEVGQLCGNCHPCQTYKAAVVSSMTVNLNDADEFGQLIDEFRKRKNDKFKNILSDETKKEDSIVDGGEKVC